MELLVAEKADVGSILDLHFRYHVDSIRENEKKDGFVTTPFTDDLLVELIEQENGAFIAKERDQVIAYIMAARWEYWSKWPLFQYMIEHLGTLSFRGETLSTENSYQYGPVCIDGAFRGSGLLEELFEFARIEMEKSFRFLVTFINKINVRSTNAHIRKLHMELIGTFTFNDNDYLELAYDAKVPLRS